MQTPQEMVVSLRRGVTLLEMGVLDKTTLAQFLGTIAHFEVTDELPTGRSLCIRIDDVELQKLTESVGEKCYIIKRSDGHVDL